jgi:RNA polymerase sigma factor (TIGR02999 family)
MEPTPEITLLIGAWQRGDPNAENALFEALYRRLHGIALQCLRNEAPGQTLGATALVHEAYLRFHNAESLTITNRAHFLALAARVMRRILVDRARARRSAKRDARMVQEDEAEMFLITVREADQILAVDRALEGLSLQSPRQARLVELRYFAGFSEDESATALGISSRQARRDWQVARTRLRIAIDGTADPA